MGTEGEEAAKRSARPGGQAVPANEPAEETHTGRRSSLGLIIKSRRNSLELDARAAMEATEAAEEEEAQNKASILEAIQSPAYEKAKADVMVEATAATLKSIQSTTYATAGAKAKAADDAIAQAAAEPVASFDSLAVSIPNKGGWEKLCGATKTIAPLTPQSETTNLEALDEGSTRDATPMEDATQAETGSPHMFVPGHQGRAKLITSEENKEIPKQKQATEPVAPEPTITTQEDSQGNQSLESEAAAAAAAAMEATVAITPPKFKAGWNKLRSSAKIVPKFSGATPVTTVSHDINFEQTELQQAGPAATEGRTPPFEEAEEAVAIERDEDAVIVEAETLSAPLDQAAEINSAATSAEIVTSAAAEVETRQRRHSKLGSLIKSRRQSLTAPEPANPVVERPTQSAAMLEQQTPTTVQEEPQPVAPASVLPEPVEPANPVVERPTQSAAMLEQQTPTTVQEEPQPVAPASVLPEPVEPANPVVERPTQSAAMLEQQTPTTVQEEPQPVAPASVLPEPVEPPTAVGNGSIQWMQQPGVDPNYIQYVAKIRELHLALDAERTARAKTQNRCHILEDRWRRMTFKQVEEKLESSATVLATRFGQEMKTLRTAVCEASDVAFRDDSVLTNMSSQSGFVGPFEDSDTWTGNVQIVDVFLASKYRQVEERLNDLQETFLFTARQHEEQLGSLRRVNESLEDEVAILRQLLATKVGWEEMPPPSSAEDTMQMIAQPDGKEVPPVTLKQTLLPPKRRQSAPRPGPPPSAAA